MSERRSQSVRLAHAAAFRARSGAVYRPPDDRGDPVRSSARATPRPVSRPSSPSDEHVTRMDRAVPHACGAGIVQRGSERSGRTHRVSQGRGALIAQHDVGRVGGDEVLHEVGPGVQDAGGKRPGDRRVLQVERDERLEFGDELVHALWRRGQGGTTSPRRGDPDQARTRERRDLTLLLRSDEEHEMDQTRLEAQFRQLPYAVEVLLAGRQLIVTLKPHVFNGQSSGSAARG